MFNFFKKRSVSIPPMVFKSDANAFEYMCKYGRLDYENDMPCIGVVIKQQEDSENYIIKIANQDDNVIPSDIDVDTMAKNPLIYCVSGSPVDDRIYKNGDLVILKVSSAVSALGMGPVAGLFQKVNPVLDSETGWEFP